MEGTKPKMVNFEKWRPSVSSYLTVAGGAIPQWTEYIPSYSGTVMVIRKQNSTKPGGRKEQRSTNSTKGNGNHTKETQHGPSQIPPNIKAGKQMERK